MTDYIYLLCNQLQCLIALNDFYCDLYRLCLQTCWMLWILLPDCILHNRYIWLCARLLCIVPCSQLYIIIHSCIDIYCMLMASPMQDSQEWSLIHVHIYAQTNARQVIMCMICEAIGNRTITCEWFAWRVYTAAGSAYAKSTVYTCWSSSCECSYINLTGN